MVHQVVLGARKGGVYHEVLDFCTVSADVGGCDQHVVKDGHVLIEIAYSDVNPVDLQKVARFTPTSKNDQHQADDVYVPGFGGSGWLRQVGRGVPAHLFGSDTTAAGSHAPRVCFLNPHSGGNACGSYASWIQVDYRCVAVIRAASAAGSNNRVSLRDAACLPVAGLTAFQVLGKLGLAKDENTIASTTPVSKATSQQAQPATNSEDEHVTVPPTASADNNKNEKKTLLIIGGAGGVGSWIITLIKAWHPTAWHVAVTASTEPQHDYCTKRLGADQVLRHDEIRKVFLPPDGNPKRGAVHKIICLTEPTPALFAACADVIRPTGQIALVVAGQSIRTLDLSFCFFKSVAVVCHTVFCTTRSRDDGGDDYETCTTTPAEELTTLLEMMARQQIQAPLSPDLQQGESSGGDAAAAGTDDNAASVVVSERFVDALKPCGVLQALSCTHGKRGNLVLRIQDEDDLIFMDLKTASLILVSRQDCLQRKILAPSKKEGGGFWEAEASVDSAEYKELVQKITKHPRLGIVKVVEKQVQDYQDGLEMQEAESVKNLWGVQLKHRTKNTVGQEVMFIDPQTGALGEVSRAAVIKSGIWTVEKGQGDASETIQEAITEEMERDQAVQSVRRALKLLTGGGED